MLRKDGPEFKEVLDGATSPLMKSCEFSKLHGKWFESPLPPKGTNLALPMSQQLKDNTKALNDKPAR
jgi:glutamate/aspartate transport system substrate-binding protein